MIKKINNEIKEYSLSIQTKNILFIKKIEENKNSLSELYDKLNEKDIETQEVNNIKFKIKQKKRRKQRIIFSYS